MSWTAARQWREGSSDREKHRKSDKANDRVGKGKLTNQLKFDLWYWTLGTLCGLTDAFVGWLVGGYEGKYEVWASRISKRDFCGLEKGCK